MQGTGKDIRAKRLEAARRKAGFSSCENACKNFGWNLNTYLSHESGVRGFIKSAEVYAKAFSVSAGWLMFGENPPEWYEEEEEGEQVAA